MNSNIYSMRLGKSVKYQTLDQTLSLFTIHGRQSPLPLKLLITLHSKLYYITTWHSIVKIIHERCSFYLEACSRCNIQNMLLSCFMNGMKLRLEKFIVLDSPSPIIQSVRLYRSRIPSTALFTSCPAQLTRSCQHQHYFCSHIFSYLNIKWSRLIKIIWHPFCLHRIRTYFAIFN